MREQETPHRVERDSMGEVEVPRDALFGAQTRRALDNFPISDLRKPRRFVEALGAIKLESAVVNKRARPARRRVEERHRGGGGGGRRGEAGPCLRPRRVPDRVWYLHQHERQRGHLQPRDPDTRRRTRLQDPCPSERPREHGPVLERRHPHGHPPRCPHLHRAGPPAGPGEASEAPCKRRPGSSTTWSRPAVRTFRTPPRSVSARSSWATPARWNAE